MERGPFSSQAVANQRGNTRGQHSFARIPRAEIQRSVFNRSHGLKTAFDASYLIPIFVDEVLPGDTMTLRTSSLVRMATPIFPVMDNMFLDFFYFSIPYRLLWENWERMNGAQDNPADDTDFLVPVFVSTGSTVAEGSLSDYLGMPLGAMSVGTGGNTGNVSIFHRAYNFVWNTWFRDQNLQDSVTVDLDDGPDTLGDYVLLRRNKQHDYFSSCLPFAQKGDPVSLPLGTFAPVVPEGTGIPLFAVGTNASTPLENRASVSEVHWDASAGIPVTSASWVDSALQADLSAATAASINDIREAFQIQRLLERDARGGTRYAEILKSHFGVSSPMDAVLQRPEYIGGGTTRINVHPVARTDGANASGGTGPTANLGAFATAVASGVGFSKSFTEHCVVLGLVNVRADLTYQQGTPRMFTRRSRFEFYWPALAHLGEQAVLTKEIFTDGTAGDDVVFGYQERYAEYRYKPSTTSSVMRSSAVAPLDAWHLGLEWFVAPELNEEFIVDILPFSRILIVSTGAGGYEFFGDFFFDYRCARPMPTYGVPGMIDHF